MSYPTLTIKYLNEQRLLKQFIDSYDLFVEKSLQKIVDEQNQIVPNIEGRTIKLGKIRLGEPSVVEADGSRRPLTPMEARMRDLTYSAPLYLEMTPLIK